MTTPVAARSSGSNIDLMRLLERSRARLPVGGRLINRASANSAFRGCRWGADGWRFAGFDEGERDLADFDVEVLGCAAKHVERLVTGDPFPLDEDALCLADEFASAERLVKVGNAQQVVGSFAGKIECETCQRREDEPLGAIGGSECGWQAGVHVEGTDRLVRETKRQGATDSCSGGGRTERGPLRSVREVGGERVLSAGEGIDARPLVARDLQIVEFDDDRVGGRDRRDSTVSEIEDPCCVATVDRGESQVDSQLQRTLH